MSFQHRHLTTLSATLALCIAPASANLMTFNSSTPANNAATRQTWLDAIGIATPQYLVDFEVGFSDGQNISDVIGLFPGELVIRDSSSAHAATIRSGNGVINGSNPVGVYSVTQNEQPYLELDFTASPVDYVALQDIDHNGTSGIVTFVDATTATIAFDGTGGSGNTAEFFGMFRNDRPQIRLVQLNASGDGLWGIDTIEYGVVFVLHPGDLDCDGDVDFDDINPFVLALSDPAGYAAAYPECNILNGDCDEDGDVDFDDINPFVALLSQ